jgi:hypothetical protein
MEVFAVVIGGVPGRGMSVFGGGMFSTARGMFAGAGSVIVASGGPRATPRWGRFTDTMIKPGLSASCSGYREGALPRCLAVSVASSRCEIGR